MWDLKKSKEKTKLIFPSLVFAPHHFSLSPFLTPHLTPPPHPPMCPPPSSLPPPPQRQPLPPPPQRQPPPPQPPQRQPPPPQPPQRQSPPPQRQSTSPQPPQRQSTPPQPPQGQSPPPKPPQRQSPPPQPPEVQSTPPQRQPKPPPEQQPHPTPTQQPPPTPPPPQIQPQLQPQNQPHPPPYPFHYQHLRPEKKSSTLASCFLATSFLIFLTIAAIVTCFILFRPKNPQISVHSMKFPSFTLQNGSANFTFFQYVAVRNPNRYAFSHYDSSLQLFSSSSGPLGFMYIPAGNIAAGKTQFMSATFDVKSFTLPPDVAGSRAGPRSGPTLELETKMKLVGSVKVLKVFAHHVEKGAKCRVTIQVSDAAVLGYKC